MLQEAYRKKPGHVDALLTAARIHLEAGPDGVHPALALVEIARRSCPHDAEAWGLSGFIHAVHLKDFIRARDDYERALTLDPGNPDYERALNRLAQRPR
jgi:hypothetical protein